MEVPCNFARIIKIASLVVLAQAILALLRGDSVSAAEDRYAITPDVLELGESVCSHYTDSDSLSPSSWRKGDCLDVWCEWESRIGMLYMKTLTKVLKIAREVCQELKRVGPECYVQMIPAHDGVGSSTVRGIATWILADEIGGHWVAPDWRGRDVDQNGTHRYCHFRSTEEEREGLTRAQIEALGLETCFLVNWQQYFNFDLNSVSAPLTNDPATREVVVSHLVKQSNSLELPSTSLLR